MFMSLCYHCFNEYSDAAVCPFCGYAESNDTDKYPLALPHGTVLGGRYIIGRVLGQGGFGITYVAQEYSARRLVAIKEYFPEQLATRKGTTVLTYTGDREENYRYGKECFLSEAKTLAEFIGNPNIVRVYSYFEENGTAYFAMEYIEGVSLKEHLKAHGGRIAYDEALHILLPVMDALSAVHAKGIIHRDISPDNIYITHDGTVKLIDFGAARYSMGDRSRSLDVVLKHGYAPKEQYTRRGRQGAYTDVYALAATFYRAVTGHVPPDSIERLEEDDLVAPSVFGCSLPAYAEDALLKALSLSPADRYQSMEQFKTALMNEPSVSAPADPVFVAPVIPAPAEPVQVTPPEAAYVTPPEAPYAPPEVDESAASQEFSQFEPAYSAQPELEPYELTESVYHAQPEPTRQPEPVFAAAPVIIPDAPADSAAAPVLTAAKTDSGSKKGKHVISLLAAAAVVVAAIVLLIVLLSKGGDDADTVRSGQTEADSSEVKSSDTDIKNTSPAESGSVLPTTEAASPSATVKPTAPAAPTTAPTVKPTAAPTVKPTTAPTVKPTAAPTVKPTNPPTTPPASNKVTVVADGRSYSIKTGNTFTYTYYLSVGDKITTFNACTEYQTSGLEMISDFYDFDRTFPIVGDGMVAYDSGNGTLRYNFSILRGKDFSSWNSVLITLTFRVTAKSGTYSINTDVIDLAGDPDFTIYYQSGVNYISVSRCEGVIYY